LRKLKLPLLIIGLTVLFFSSDIAVDARLIRYWHFGSLNDGIVYRTGALYIHGKQYKEHDRSVSFSYDYSKKTFYTMRKYADASRALRILNDGTGEIIQTLDGSFFRATGKWCRVGDLLVVVKDDGRGLVLIDKEGNVSEMPLPEGTNESIVIQDIVSGDESLPSEVFLYCTPEDNCGIARLDSRTITMCAFNRSPRDSWKNLYPRETYLRYGRYAKLDERYRLALGGIFDTEEMRFVDSGFERRYPLAGWNSSQPQFHKVSESFFVAAIHPDEKATLNATLCLFKWVDGEMTLVRRLSESPKLSDLTFSYRGKDYLVTLDGKMVSPSAFLEIDYSDAVSNDNHYFFVDNSLGIILQHYKQPYTLIAAKDVGEGLEKVQAADGRLYLLFHDRIECRNSESLDLLWSELWSKETSSDCALLKKNGDIFLIDDAIRKAGEKGLNEIEPIPDIRGCKVVYSASRDTCAFVDPKGAFFYIFSGDEWKKYDGRFPTTRFFSLEKYFLISRDDSGHFTHMRPGSFAEPSLESDWKRLPGVVDIIAMNGDNLFGLTSFDVWDLLPNRKVFEMDRMDVTVNSASLKVLPPVVRTLLGEEVFLGKR